MRPFLARPFFLLESMRSIWFHQNPLGSSVKCVGLRGINMTYSPPLFSRGAVLLAAPVKVGARFHRS